MFLIKTIFTCVFWQFLVLPCILLSFFFWNSYIIKIKARTVVGAGKATEELIARTNREVLPVVRLLRVEETDAFTALMRWDRPTNADKFKDYTLKYIVSVTNIIKQIIFINCELDNVFSNSMEILSWVSFWIAC